MNLIGIYFINQPDINLIKVGLSTNIIVRLKLLQGSNSNKLVYLGYIPTSKKAIFVIEKQIHEILYKYKHHGEWFNNFNMDIIINNYNFITNECNEINNYLTAIFEDNQSYVSEYAKIKQKNNDHRLRKLHAETILRDIKLENTIYNYIKEFGQSSIFDISYNLNIRIGICKKKLSDMIAKDMIKHNEEYLIKNRLYTIV